VAFPATRRRGAVKFKLTVGTIMAAGSIALVTACGGSSSSSSTVSASCKPKHAFPTIHKGVLTVSSYSYPMATIVQGSDLGGVEGALLHKVASMECLQFKLLSQAGPGVIPAVQSGRADLAAGDWYRTKDRAKVLNLSAPIYLDKIVFVSRGGAVRTVQDLIGKRVGSTEGNLFNADVSKLLGGHFHTYQTTLDAYQDLTNGRLDAVIDGAAGATNSLKKIGNPDLKIAAPPPDPRVGATTSPGQAGWPVGKHNDALVKALDDDIANLRRTGEVNRLLTQYGFPKGAGDVGKPHLL
jgi:polar amino acid transport system substrate-binding protein